MRLDYHVDDNEHLTNILREWKRRDWGEGGADFHWWCTEDSLAFVGAKSVYATMKDEIIEMIGEAPYERLAEYVEAQGTEHLLPHPARKKRDSKPEG